MKIAKTLTAGLCALSLSSAFAGPPPPMETIVEEPTSIGASISVGYDSSYIFRGVKFADDSVWGQVDYAYDINDNLTFKSITGYAQTDYYTHTDFKTWCFFTFIFSLSKG